MNESTKWETGTLGEVADYVNGYPFKPKHLTDVGVPVIRIRQLLNPGTPVDRTEVVVPERNHLHDGDLIFSWSGTLASRIWNRGPAYLNQHLFKVIPHEQYSREWLQLILDHAIEELLTKAHGTTMKHITKGVLESHSVANPPPEDRIRILALIGSIDKQIAALDGEQDALIQTDRALRLSAFEQFADSSMIVAKEKFGMLLGRQKSERQSIGDHVIPYLRAGNIADTGMKLDDVRTMNFDPREQKKYGLQRDDVVLSEGGTVGLAARWTEEITGTVGFDKHVIRLRPIPGVSTPEFALHWAKWTKETGAFDVLATGITIKALGFGRASQMLVPDLSIDEQRQLTAPLETVSSTIMLLSKESSRLRAMRSALLNAVLNREVEIPESFDRVLPREAAA